LGCANDGCVDPSAAPAAAKQAKALYPYAGGEGQLQFEPGAIIDIESEQSAEWWIGTCNGQRGVFPANYVQLVDTSSAAQIAQLQAQTDQMRQMSVSAPPAAPAAGAGGGGGLDMTTAAQAALQAIPELSGLQYAHLSVATPGDEDNEYQFQVTDPQTHGTGMDAHVVFTVISRLKTGNTYSKICVSRRYSDFKWLFDVLVELYSGSIIPPLPSKDMLYGIAGKSGKGGEKTDGFMIKRARGLCVFLFMVVSHAELRDSAILREFLSDDSMAWAACKERTKMMLDKKSTMDKLSGWVDKKKEQLKENEKIGNLATQAGVAMESRQTSLEDQEWEGYNIWADNLNKRVTALAGSVGGLAKSIKDSSENHAKVATCIMDVGDVDDLARTIGLRHLHPVLTASTKHAKAQAQRWAECLDVFQRLTGSLCGALEKRENKRFRLQAAKINLVKAKTSSSSQKVRAKCDTKQQRQQQQQRVCGAVLGGPWSGVMPIASL
jgi:hypothetical protein